MTRHVVRLACAAALATLSGPAMSAAPVPEHLMPKERGFAYPPAGSVWEYETGQGTVTHTVGKVAAGPGGATLVTIEVVRPNGPPRHHMTLSVRATGIFLVGEQGRDYPTPWCICKLPHREGETWATDGHGGDMRAGPAERVKTPAGEFLAYKVEWEHTPGQTATYWYASGYGLVKMSGGSNLALKAFTRSKG